MYLRRVVKKVSSVWWNIICMAEKRLPIFENVKKVHFKSQFLRQKVRKENLAS